MSLRDLPIDRFLVPPGKKLRLSDYPTTFRDFEELDGIPKEELKEKAKGFLDESLEELAESQELLWASDTYSVLAVFQAMDAAGKDSTIKHVMSGVNPQGCHVVSFKQPSAEELDHTFLWRIMKSLPERGRIGIFNRSHYEDVLVVRVHPELLEHAKLPSSKRGKGFWKKRLDDITNFEHHLARNGTAIVKFFLHVSTAEQKKRFLARLDEPDKNWKFSFGDVVERGFWDDYMEAYEDAIAATTTDFAPWYVVPADEKWATRAIVGHVLAKTIGSLGLELPKLGEKERAKLDDARQMLLNE